MSTVISVVILTLIFESINCFTVITMIVMSIKIVVIIIIIKIWIIIVTMAILYKVVTDMIGQYIAIINTDSSIIVIIL